MTNKHFQRIESLRKIMQREGWDAVVLRGSDPHSSEYLAPRYQVVTWLSGFTGEAGDMVVTMDEAGLWTDSRYFIQAAEQLDGSGIELHKTRLPESEYIPEFLRRKACTRVACDSLCESVASAAEIREACAGSEGFELVGVPDLIDVIWEERPALPCSPVISLDESTVGRTRLEKIEWLRAWLADMEEDYVLIGALDQVAWMLNVRGSDIDYNPVVFSYLLVSQDSVQFFMLKDSERDEDTVDTIELLESEGISVEKYSAVVPCLRQILENGESVCYDPASLNAELGDILAEQRQICSPVELEKAIKNSAEIEGMREAHMEDGLAVEKFLYWLEQRLSEGPVSEWEAACKLHQLRKEIPGYMGDSFETISAWGPGAALPHYCTPKDGSTMIQPRGLYLVDSGGQYLFGTTDITRTVPVGETSYLEKEDYSLALKGMINLSTAVFPYGTAGCQIDALAREAMWRYGRNFGHGTGHGVGFFLGVHEGPQSIRQNFLQQPLLPGMISSDEPGIYREGMHGIRHENLILCREAYTNSFGRWLSFETLTLCHIDTAAVLPQLLSNEEREWLNAYNERVYRTFAPAIEDAGFEAWLRKKTLPL